jgi:hypothetical protein
MSLLLISLPTTDYWGQVCSDARATFECLLVPLCPFDMSFFLICRVGGGVQTGSTRHVGHLLAYCT